MSDSIELEGLIIKTEMQQEIQAYQNSHHLTVKLYQWRRYDNVWTVERLQHPEVELDL